MWDLAEAQEDYAITLRASQEPFLNRDTHRLAPLRHSGLLFYRGKIHKDLVGIPPRMYL